MRRQQRQQRRLWRRSILRGGSRRDAAEAEERVLIFSLHSLLLRHISSPRSRRRIATFSCFVFFSSSSLVLLFAHALPVCCASLVYFLHGDAPCNKGRSEKHGMDPAAVRLFAAGWPDGRWLGGLSVRNAQLQ